MIGLLKKIKHHGIQGSLKILSQKKSIYERKKMVLKGKYLYERNSLRDHFLNILSQYFSATHKPDFRNIDVIPDKEKLLSNKFILLNKEFDFGETVNWKFLPASISSSYPDEFEGSINIYNYSLYGDYRITWELNRHHFFTDLAVAYSLTKNEDYIVKLNYLFKSWVKENRTGFGINFVSPMEIAIRLMNWLLCFFILHDNSRDLFSANPGIVTSILSQSKYLNDNLTVHKTKKCNNHSIVELSALLIIRSILNWDEIYEYEYIEKELLKELDTQFYEDGMNFEQSPHYTRFTIEALLMVLLFTGRKNSLGLMDKIHSYAGNLLLFVAPDDKFINLNDADDGRILKTGFLQSEEQTGFFNFLARYLNDNNLLIDDSINNECRFLLSIFNCLENVTGDKEKNILSKYPEGYWVHRDDNKYILFKSSYPGNKNLDFEYAPHAHNDILSFVFYSDGKPVLVDSGTFNYDLSIENGREYFRSIYAHNTIVIDKKNHFFYNEPFNSIDLPDISMKKISTSEVEGILVKNEYRISRKIKVSKEEIFFEDSVEKIPVPGSIEIILNFHPDIILSKISDNSLQFDNGTSKYLVVFKPGSGCEINLVNGFYSGRYNDIFKTGKAAVRIIPAGKISKINWSIKQIVK
jgi:hypothetical protein